MPAVAPPPLPWNTARRHGSSQFSDIVANRPSDGMTCRCIRPSKKAPDESQDSTQSAMQSSDRPRLDKLMALLGGPIVSTSSDSDSEDGIRLRAGRQTGSQRRAGQPQSQTPSRAERRDLDSSRSPSLPVAPGIQIERNESNARLTFEAEKKGQYRHCTDPESAWRHHYRPIQTRSTAYQRQPAPLTPPTIAISLWPWGLISSIPIYLSVPLFHFRRVG